MIKHKIEVKADGGRSGNLVLEDKSYTAMSEINKKIDSLVWQAFRQAMQTPNVGDKGSINLSVSWECTMNGRAPARPKDVIAAEKAASAGKKLKRQQEREEGRKRAAQQVANMRNRIKHQVDHAFALGKHGTEPAAKYITCQHCDAPAAVLSLSNAPARGSSVLDEDTIVGALCADHSQYVPYYGSNTIEKILCSRLEFFYDGIRQIAVKP